MAILRWGLLAMLLAACEPESICDPAKCSGCCAADGICKACSSGSGGAGGSTGGVATSRIYNCSLQYHCTLAGVDPPYIDYSSPAGTTCAKGSLDANNAARAACDTSKSNCTCTPSCSDSGRSC